MTNSNSNSSINGKIIFIVTYHFLVLHQFEEYKEFDFIQVSIYHLICILTNLPFKLLLSLLLYYSSLKMLINVIYLLVHYIYLYVLIILVSIVIKSILLIIFIKVCISVVHRCKGKYFWSFILSPFKICNEL